MHQLFLFLLLFLSAGPVLSTEPGNNPASQSPELERHMNEAGSSVLFARSTFAHGYRHGYEEGYHVGNVDINMGRPAHTRLSQLHGLSLGYAPQFGPRKSFESGFREGLKAGYSDGYAGRVFRAVDTLRLVAASLTEAPAADPRNMYFDQGFSSGYNDGAHPVQNAVSSTSNGDSHVASCSQLPGAAAEKDQAGRQSFCQGYERGRVLGRADALALGTERPPMQAHK